MAKTAKKTAKSTQMVVTIVTPDEHGIQRSGTIIAQYGDLAYVMPFKYCHAADIAHAYQMAQRKLAELRQNPPQVTNSTTPAASTPPMTEAVPADTPENTSAEDETGESNDATDDVVYIGRTRQHPARVGDGVRFLEGAVDAAGAPLRCTQGVLYEFDTLSVPARAWVETDDPDNGDVWVNVHHIEPLNVPAASASAAEKPVHLKRQADGGQLSLFGDSNPSRIQPINLHSELGTVNLELSLGDQP